MKPEKPRLHVTVGVARSRSWTSSKAIGYEQIPNVFCPSPVHSTQVLVDRTFVTPPNRYFLVFRWWYILPTKYKTSVRSYFNISNKSRKLTVFFKSEFAAHLVLHVQRTHVLKKPVYFRDLFDLLKQDHTEVWYFVGKIYDHWNTRK